MLERDEYFTIGGANRGAVAEGQVEGFSGHADVVEQQVYFFGWDDPVDFGFDGAEDLLGDFDACAAGCLYVQAKCAGVNSGEEVATDEGK